MTSKNIPRLPRTQRERRVFSQRKRPSKRLPVWRMLLESVLLLLLGSGLLAGLSWLPTQVDALVVVSEAIADLIRGLSQLLEAFLGLSAVILIAALLLLGLLALISGLIRFVRTLVVVFKSSARRQALQSPNAPTRSSRSARRRRLRRSR
ncbi:hypothetical protein WB44_03380 [Synechococcus sp. WH 8020]|uniref:hypothetical protein n=1 Tax=unclassified Synechococcus TaxID=2626047 RepID=UPI000652705C|nr:hypothetical protein [Synechococcus sp. WH 8020]AKN60321.1 hypothetical protein WB44_03380 [Synechococcus sp. WH 8020]